MDSPQYVFGAQAFGVAWTNENVGQLMQALNDHGIHHFDTAALYPATAPGGSEKLLGEKKQPGAVIDTKVMFMLSGMLSKENMEKSIRDSLERLQLSEIHTLFTHAPDRQTPIAEQAANFDHFYRAGLFQQLGLSNYTPAMVREWLDIATEKNYVKPSVFEGQYNIFCRGYEEDLFPLLREHNMTFAATSPLAGGFLTGKLTFSTSPADLAGTRFEAAEGNMLGAVYRMWYDQPVFHEAMRTLKDLAHLHHTTPEKFAMRWLLFHSPLRSADTIVIGPNNFSQLNSYLEARQAGALPADVALAIDNLFGPLREVAAPMIEAGWWSL